VFGGVTLSVPFQKEHWIFGFDTAHAGGEHITKEIAVNYTNSLARQLYQYSSTKLTGEKL
jgi:hypothetical protein